MYIGVKIAGNVYDECTTAQRQPQRKRKRPKEIPNTLIPIIKTKKIKMKAKAIIANPRAKRAEAKLVVKILSLNCYLKIKIQWYPGLKQILITRTRHL